MDGRTDEDVLQTLEATMLQVLTDMRNELQLWQMRQGRGRRDEACDAAGLGDLSKHEQMLRAAEGLLETEEEERWRLVESWQTRVEEACLELEQQVSAAEASLDDVENIAPVEAPHERASRAKVVLEKLEQVRSQSYLATSAVRRRTGPPILAYENRSLLTSLPQRPLYKEVCRSLQQWAACGRFPHAMPRIDGYTEVHGEDAEPMQALTPMVQELFSISLESPLFKDALTQAMLELGLPGILRLLRLRNTPGTLPLFPAGASVLLNAFNSKHTLGAGKSLTVGGRALTKHHTRSSDGFWGVAGGAHDRINEQAEAVLRKICEDAAWFNIHSLPHETPVFEVRTIEGYGARWAADGSAFRGFLEPYMPDGHQVGWRH